MKRLSWVYTDGWQYRDRKTGFRFITDPVCQMLGEGLCGKPATKRVWHLPHWSIPWCDEHAEIFR